MSQCVEFDPVVAQILLDLADNRKDIKTDTQGSRLALVVPNSLWARYELYQGLQEKKGAKK